MESSNSKKKRFKIPWLYLIHRAKLDDEFEIYCFIHGKKTMYRTGQVYNKGISLNRCARAFCVKHKLLNYKVKKDYSTLDKCVEEFNKSFGYVS